MHNKIKVAEKLGLSVEEILDIYIIDTLAERNIKVVPITNGAKPDDEDVKAYIEANKAKIEARTKDLREAKASYREVSRALEGL